MSQPTRPARLAHQAPDACFICGDGSGPHAPIDNDYTTHDYWPNSEADSAFREYDRRVALAGGAPQPSMTAVETLDPREAVLV